MLFNQLNNNDKHSLKINYPYKLLFFQLQAFRKPIPKLKCLYLFTMITSYKQICMVLV